MVKQYALKIEYLLRIINPQRKYGCDDIELNPYMAIFQELNGRISSLLSRRTYQTVVLSQIHLGNPRLEYV